MLLTDTKNKTQMVTVTVANRHPRKRLNFIVDQDKAHLFNDQVLVQESYSERVDRRYYKVMTDTQGEKLYTKAKAQDRFYPGVPLTTYIFNCNSHRSKKSSDTDYSSQSYINSQMPKGSIKFYTESEVVAFYKELEGNLIASFSDANTVFDDDDFEDETFDVGQTKALNFRQSEEQHSDTVNINGVELSIEDARKILGINVR